MMTRITNGKNQSIPSGRIPKAAAKEKSPRNMYPRFFIWVFLTLLFWGFPGAAVPVSAQDLSIGPEDLRIEQRADSGFHLFVRKKAGIGSVLLTESTRDPAMGADNFAYRAPLWNPVNGDELRLLDGVPISRESGIFSLVDSTPESHPELGEAFHIFIPWIVRFGYENGRNGELYATDGTYFNIRSFTLPYADYRGEFADNPFILRAVQKPPETHEGVFMKEAEDAFSEIARDGQGEFIHAADPADLISKIEGILKEQTGKSVDIVLCLDTTASMKPYIDGVREMLIPMMRELTAGFKDFRIGMILYKDYFDEYLNRFYPFTGEFGLFQRNLNAISVRGGGDVPEAVYEALYEGTSKFAWAAESKLLILIGDAPPHPRQRGKISGEMVYRMAAEKEIKVNAIILSR